MRRAEFGRERVDAQFLKSGTLFDRIPAMDTAELAAIGEAEHAFVQLERNVDVHAVFKLIGAEEEDLCSGKPEELAIEAKMKREQSAVEVEKQVFPAALDSLNLLSFCGTRELRRFLRLRGARMKDVDATNPLVHDERTQSARNGFYFREFGHF